MYLLDTDIIGNILKKKPSGKLIKKLKVVPREFQFTTSVNVGEMFYGAFWSEAKDRLIEVFLNKVFPNLTILNFDYESARIFGEMKYDLERKGTGLSEPDMRIASIAKQHKLTLITRNVKHFGRVPGLKVENWID